MSMKIWFDITNISTFTAGVVGIIRAELEIAYNFAKLSDDVGFCRLNQAGDGIEAVSREDLGWLLDAKTPVDGFLARSESLKPVWARKPNTTVMPAHVHAWRNGRGRFEHAKLSFQKMASVLPRGLFNLVYYTARPVFRWLGSAVRAYRDGAPHAPAQQRKRANAVGANGAAIVHPFQPGDVLFACGWKDSNKEKVYGKIRRNMDLDFHISYLIYDTILINKKTKFLYDENAEKGFLSYFRWISSNCSL